jgi:hypothetical protein
MRLYNKGNFTLESDLARSAFGSRVSQKLSEVMQILPTMSREYRRCDPKNQIEGKTFVRMTNFLQVSKTFSGPITRLVLCFTRHSDYWLET